MTPPPTHTHAHTRAYIYIYIYIALDSNYVGPALHIGWTPPLRHRLVGDKKI